MTKILVVKIDLEKYETAMNMQPGDVDVEQFFKLFETMFSGPVKDALTITTEE